MGFHARSRVPTQLTGLNPRPCGTQEGGSSCPVTDPDGWAAYRPPGACGCPPCFFSAAPFKAVELRSTPGKLLKKFDQNFFAPPASLFRLCGTQKGGLSRPATDPDGWAAYRPPGACGCPPCFFSAAPFKAVELRSTPGKLLKKFDQNFFAPPAALFRPCGTQKGGLSRPATDRLVLCGHAPLTCLRRILQTPGLQSPR